MRQICQKRQDPALLCSLFVKSQPTWLLKQHSTSVSLLIEQPSDACSWKYLLITLFLRVRVSLGLCFGSHLTCLFSLFFLHLLLANFAVESPLCDVKTQEMQLRAVQSTEAVWKSRWTSWAPRAYGLCRRKQQWRRSLQVRVQDLCESRGGHPGLPVPDSLHGLSGRKSSLKKKSLGQSSGAVWKKRWMSVIIRKVSVDVKQH